MSEVTDLTDAVQYRYGTQYLIELTNSDDASAITVNTTVLQAAAQDTIAVFEMETGINFDSTNNMHLYVCCGGTVAHLEAYKGRDVGLSSARWKSFLGALNSIRTKTALLPASNSMYSTSQETQTVRPDMDRDRPAFKKSRAGGSVQEISE